MLSKPSKRLRLGDLLVEMGSISRVQLRLVLDEQKRSGRRLGEAAMDLGFITEENLIAALAQSLGIEVVDLKTYKYDKEFVQVLPEAKARKYRSMVLSQDSSGYVVGMADPMDLYSIDELQLHLGVPVFPVIVKETDLEDCFDQVYRGTEEISTIATELGDELSDSDSYDLDSLSFSGSVEEAPVSRLLHSIFADALKAKASDIHIEPDEEILRIRQRIDGVLHEQIIEQSRVAQALVVRLKIMSSLDISERRIPQDGRFNIKVGSRNVDVRLSTMPVTHGESVVMRLLDQTNGASTIAQLNLPPRIETRLRSLIRRPHGMILVTGPTGSGKTTTLYSILHELNIAQRKIITVEDPVEYQMSRVNQVQVNHKVGLDFAKVLRAVLRQDPDVVLVGEMRDGETVSIGLRAAMTGHLLLSTLHTNDAISTAIRLLDMGAESYLCASALCAVIAQRLVRKVCKYCNEPYEPLEREEAWVRKISGQHKHLAGLKYIKGKGCDSCNHTGYSGRIAVFELLEMTTELSDALRLNDPFKFSNIASQDPKFYTISQSALEYAGQGITSLEEVFRLSSDTIE